MAVAVLPLNNPLCLAESYGMVDVVSDGRLDFGIGKGSEPVEYVRLGARREEATQRMIEGTEILRQAWSDEPVNFHGEFFDFDNVRVLPKPVQRPHPPIWVGATRTEETFRWAGENGFNLMTIPFVHPTHGGIAWPRQIYREALERAAHDSATRQILAKFHIYVSDSLEQGIREAAPYMKNYSAIHAAVDPNRKLTNRDIVLDMERGFIIVGDPQRCIDTIRRWQEEVGLTTFPLPSTSAACPRRWRSRISGYLLSASCPPWTEPDRENCNPLEQADDTFQRTFTSPHRSVISTGVRKSLLQ